MFRIRRSQERTEMASLREILLRQEAERKEKIKSENESFLKAFIAAAVNGEFRVPQAFVVSEWLRSDGRGDRMTGSSLPTTGDGRQWLGRGWVLGV